VAKGPLEIKKLGQMFRFAVDLTIFGLLQNHVTGTLVQNSFYNPTVNVNMDVVLQCIDLSNVLGEGWSL